MAYTTIDKPSDYFNTVLYTGNGSTNAITGVGFQPDFVWVKRRNGASKSMLYDIARSANFLQTEATDAEQDGANFFVSLDSDGFTFEGSDNSNNASSQTYVAWNWLGSNTTASNTDGSITSTVSANTTSGFSIVTYTGTGSAATVGHGLGSAPAFYVIKQRDAVGGWIVYHKGNTSAPETDYLRLDKTDPTVDDAIFNDTAPTSSVFSIGINAPVNTSSGTYVAYCFAEKKGFSKFGSYIGSANADGPFIYTGFKPAWVLFKNTTDTGDDWILHDSKRDLFNVTDNGLAPNSSAAEFTDVDIDILSNGFKIRNITGRANGSGKNYIYMAFAENPFVTSGGIPCTAR